MAITVLIVDDDEQFRSVVNDLLKARPEVKVLGEAGKSALLSLRRGRRGQPVKGTILVVDDNEVMQKLVREILENQGYRVLQATRALDGISLAKARRPDLILMDIELPDLDGLFAVKVLRRDPATAAIPVAAFTAYGTRADREAARQAGCVGYIAKPFHLDAFLRMVAALLHQPVAEAPPGPQTLKRMVITSPSATT